MAAFLRGLIFLDPDFGWHVREGQLIVQKGIQITDPFSYSMPSFHFIDHEWLANIFISLTYKYFGIYFLSFIFSVIFVLSLFVSIPDKFKNYSFFPFILAGIVILNFSGIRTQVITWLFLSILLKVALDDKLWNKWKFFLPLIFLPWVNLHGGFAVGIVILFLVFLAKFVQNRKFEFDNFLIMFFSIFFTFVNPYGPKIWQEIWMQISDSSLRWRISEWVPGVFYLDVAFLFLLSLSFIFILKYREKFKLWEIITYSLLLLMSLSSLRHIPLWALASIFVTSKAFFQFGKDIKKDKISIQRYHKVKIILTVIMIGLFLLEGTLSISSANSMSEKKYYPVNAISYLKTQKINGNVFSTYDWGGYLIWKQPEQKVFIDGRMPSWRRDGFFFNESNNAFVDYQKMFSEKSFFKKMIFKYNIQYVLMPKIPQPDKNLFRKRLENFERKLFHINKEYSISQKDLSETGMRKVYDDGKSVIYQR